MKEAANDQSSQKWTHLDLNFKVEIEASCTKIIADETVVSCNQ